MFRRVVTAGAHIVQTLVDDYNFRDKLVLIGSTSSDAEPWVAGLYTQFFDRGIPARIGMLDVLNNGTQAGAYLDVYKHSIVNGYDVLVVDPVNNRDTQDKHLKKLMAQAQQFRDHGAERLFYVTVEPTHIYPIVLPQKTEAPKRRSLWTLPFL